MYGENSECRYVNEHGQVFCLCLYGWMWYVRKSVCVCIQGGFCGVKLCVKERMGVAYEWKDGWPVCVSACCV